MWMGTWAPVVYRFSSNWKELKTLALTLEHVLATDPESVRGATVFYFTDNSTVYWIAAAGASHSPGLHALIERIRELELRLGCMLQVVHVPGVVMIRQGTDGLSRGIWASPFHDLYEPRWVNQMVFEPLRPDWGLAEAMVSWLGHTGGWRVQDWTAPWREAEHFDTLSIWFPPPELARQVLNFFLNAWVERPLTTAGLFFVPRVVPAFWHGLSRYVVELPAIYPTEPWLPLRYPPSLPIPIVVLYIAPHLRALPVTSPSRVGPSPSAALVRWHREQAEHMRRVQHGLQARRTRGLSAVFTRVVFLFWMAVGPRPVASRTIRVASVRGCRSPRGAATVRV